MWPMQSPSLQGCHVSNLAGELCKLSNRVWHMSEGLSSAGMGRGIDGLMGKAVMGKSSR